MTRLETLSKEISTKVKKSIPQKKIDLIFAACEFAIKKSQIDHPLIKSILSKIKGDRKITQIEKIELEKLANELDDKYLSLQEASEEGKATDEEYIEFFSKTRAAFALLFAFNEDLTIAASEAVYEAALVVEDTNELFSILNKIIEEN